MFFYNLRKIMPNGGIITENWFSNFGDALKAVSDVAPYTWGRIQTQLEEKGHAYLNKDGLIVNSLKDEKGIRFMITKEKWMRVTG